MPDYSHSPPRRAWLVLATAAVLLIIDDALPDTGPIDTTAVALVLSTVIAMTAIVVATRVRLSPAAAMAAAGRVGRGLLVSGAVSFNDHGFRERPDGGRYSATAARGTSPPPPRLRQAKPRPVRPAPGPALPATR